MDLRKIQLTGGSSYTVTLPKEWVQKARLSAGDVVGFTPLPDGSLAVVPDARADPAPVRHEIELAGEDVEHAFRRIIAAYLTGYDVIVVRSSKPMLGRMRRAVRDATRRIIGLEVTDEDATSVVLQDFMDPREFHIEKCLRRMQALTRAMQEDALRAFREEPDEAAESFDERDDEVDRLYWMVNKQYHAVLRDPAYATKTGLNASQALNYLFVARLVERTADHARRIADNLRALRGGDIQAKLEARIERQGKKAFHLFAEALAAFHKRDAAHANRVIEDARSFQSSQDTLIRDSLSLGGEDILHVAYALESIGRTAAYAADISETAINHHVAME